MWLLPSVIDGTQIPAIANKYGNRDSGSIWVARIALSLWAVLGRLQKTLEHQDKIVYVIFMA